jgi:zinc finger/BTB domain-containing protein 41
VKALEKLMSDNKFIEENDSFVSLESTNVNGLAINDNVYDDIEGSERFYKDKDDSAEYTDLENSHNKSIDDFIKTLPEDISYHSEFDQSTAENLDETDYIMERINQMDHSMDEDIVPNLDEEVAKKKFKTQRVSCEVCQKTLSKGSIKNHMRLVHSGVKNYECDVCREKYESKMEVVRHKAREHPKDRRSKLGRVMSNNSSLDETSHDGMTNSSMLDDNSRDAPVNLLNVTIPSDTIEEMVDKFAEEGVSV